MNPDRQSPMPRTIPAILSVLLLAACTGGPPDELPSGRWGGEAVLTVGGDSSSLTAGCLFTTLPGAIALDADGRFSLPVTLSWFAPVMRSAPGRVDGVLRKQRLTLAVVETQDEQDVGTYALHLGAPIPVDGCLVR